MIGTFKQQSYAFLLALLISYDVYGDINEPVKRIDGGVQTSLYSLHDSVMTMSFFSPDCTWCKKQHRVIETLLDECQKLNPVMIGINGSDMNYRRALRRMSNSFPAIHAPKSILASLPNRHVPRIIIIDKQWQVAVNVVGFTDLQTLRAMVIEQSLCS